jgi:hypothetical protein
MSTLNVDKVDPSTGTDLELGTSGDTITVPTGAGLTVTDEVKTNKVSPATGTAFALGDSGDTFTVPSGATIVNSGTATGFGITAASFLPTAAPLIINGDFAVAQRTTSTASVSSGANFVADRFAFGPSTAGTWTISQEALTADEAFEDGFSTAFKADNTTANASLSAGSSLQFTQKIEAQDLQLIKYGSSTAEKMTLGFWVKATKTGTNIVEIYGHDSSRSVSIAYTISVTNTWEFKIVDIPADTGGTINNDNGAGLEIVWWLAAGTNFTSGSLQTSWGANTATARAVGQVNNADSTSNNFHITGVQLEVGTYTSSTIPPFQHESIGSNLARCQRYFWAICPADALSANSRVGLGATLSTTRIEVPTIFPVRMRTKPTLVSSGTVDDFYLYDLITNSETTNGIGLTASGSAVAQGVYHTCASGLTAGSATQVLTGNTNARLSFDSEL